MVRRPCSGGSQFCCCFVLIIYLFIFKRKKYLHVLWTWVCSADTEGRRNCGFHEGSCITLWVQLMVMQWCFCPPALPLRSQGQLIAVLSNRQDMKCASRGSVHAPLTAVPPTCCAEDLCSCVLHTVRSLKKSFLQGLYWDWKECDCFSTQLPKILHLSYAAYTPH